MDKRQGYDCTSLPVSFFLPLSNMYCSSTIRLATFVVFYYFEDYTYNMIASLDFYIE